MISDPGTFRIAEQHYNEFGATARQRHAGDEERPHVASRELRDQTHEDANRLGAHREPTQPPRNPFGLRLPTSKSIAPGRIRFRELQTRSPAIQPAPNQTPNSVRSTTVQRTVGDAKTKSEGNGVNPHDLNGNVDQPLARRVGFFTNLQQLRFCQTACINTPTPNAKSPTESGKTWRANQSREMDRDADFKGRISPSERPDEF